MLPKIASALARVLDPIKPLQRPGQSLTTSKSADSSGGGHGTTGYEAPPKEKPEGEDASPDFIPDALANPASTEKQYSPLPFKPGLTQVILDLNAQRVERSSESAALSYETGAKDQKKNARLPKGSMLDKKVG